MLHLFQSLVSFCADRGQWDWLVFVRAVREAKQKMPVALAE